jgi:hypothetical protein
VVVVVVYGLVVEVVREVTFIRQVKRFLLAHIHAPRAQVEQVVV